MSFLDFLSSGLTVGTQAAGAAQQGEAEGKARRQQDLLQRIALLRQQSQDADTKRLHDAMVGNYQSETEARLHPKPIGPPETVAPGHGIRNAQGGYDVPVPGAPRNIDPNSAEGITAAGKKATDAAKAAATYGVEQVSDPNNPNAPPTYTTRLQAPGQTAKTTLRIDSAQNKLTDARAQAAISEMNNAHSGRGGMGEYEQKLVNKQADISGLSQFMGSVANTFTHDDPMSKAAQSAALATLNRVNPDLARYIRRGLSFAEGESMISQRPSDFRTRMASFLSQAASGASPEMVQDIQSRRQSILTPLNALYPAGGPIGRTGATSRPPSGESPADMWERLVKSGMSKDQATARVKAANP